MDNILKTLQGKFSSNTTTSTSNVPSTEQIGNKSKQQLPKYQLLEKIGEGTYGILFFLFGWVCLFCIRCCI